MSYIKVGNKIVTNSIYDILLQIRTETKNNYFKDIIKSGNQLKITCPIHKDGHEVHPSCFITDDVNSDINGVWHCFTCNYSGNIFDLVAHCFNQDLIFAYEWLEERFANIFIVHEESLPEIQLNNKIQNRYIDEKELEQYKYFHPYMFQRGLTEDIIRKFKVGCTPSGDYLIFPCWDIHGNLIGIFKRSTKNKKFIIPQGIDKPIYLLNFVLQENIYTVYVCEGIIDTLYMWSIGYPAIGLFGTGTKHQYEILKKSGIRNYILCFDGDEAGDKGCNRFIKNMGKECFITVKQLPRGKDVNNLNKEEFDKLPTL